MPAVEARSLLEQLRAARRLPSPPGTALRVLQLSRREDTDVQQIAATVMSDPALSTRLLKYANSSMMGAGREVTSVRDAVLLLGLRAVKLTALGFSLAAPDLRPQCIGFNMSAFWAGSFATAVLARRLADQVFKTDREEAFTGGLLAGIGQLALAYGLPEDYGKVLQAAEGQSSLFEVEEKMLGLDHGEFGGRLLDEWGLPDVLVRAVECQREVSPLADLNDREKVLVRAVRAARQLAPVFTEGEAMSAEHRRAARLLIEEELKLDEAGWQHLAEAVLADYREMAELFEIKLEDRAAVFDLYAEAQEEATKVGMVAQLERSQALEENKTLRHQATTDPLTGMANRAKYEERLRELNERLHSQDEHFAVLILDVDHFKKFNDTYGHDLGDVVLKEVAQAVFNTLRPVDLLARYGGEEFVVLAPCSDRRTACVVAVRACRAVERLRVPANGTELQVTISVGLALTSDYVLPPEPEKLVADADKQLYLSKEGGRNTWSYLGRTAAKVTAGANR